ncbi:unnamed protein product [Rhizophagus irregularis]|nr:unnamed protein product [Rhizophagus irregularis]
MSVATEGSEEIFVQVTRETRQASKINQICTKIDEILAQKQNQTLVKITLPELVECNEYVQQVIFDKYSAEMIGEDLFIKIDGGNKTKIQFKLCLSGYTHNQNWHKPFVNACPPPDVYIEIFYNRDPDRGFALEKLVVIQQNNLGIEFIGIALPDGQAPFPQNPNPGVASVPSTPVNPPNVRPSRAPYFVYWNGHNPMNEEVIMVCMNISNHDYENLE